MAKSKRRITGTTPSGRSRGSGPVLSPLKIGLVVAAALLIVGGLIVLGSQRSSGAGGGGPIDTSRFPTLGDNNAPVTMIEFSDYG